MNKKQSVTVTNEEALALQNAMLEATQDTKTYTLNSTELNDWKKQISMCKSVGMLKAISGLFGSIKDETIIPKLRELYAIQYQRVNACPPNFSMISKHLLAVINDRGYQSCTNLLSNLKNIHFAGIDGEPTPAELNYLWEVTKCRPVIDWTV